MHLREMMQDRAQALDRAEAVVNAADALGRPYLNHTEQRDYDAHIATAQDLSAKIKTIESQNTLSAAFKKDRGFLLGGGQPEALSGRWRKPEAPRLSAEYADDFLAFLQSNGTNRGAALYEGSNSAGGYAVPVVVD